MSDFDSAEQSYLYPADKIVRCAMCEEIIDVDECMDPDCIYCDDCYEMFNEKESEDENE